MSMLAKTRTEGGWLSGPGRSQQAELIDDFNQSDSDIAKSFRDIQRINRFLGGISVIRKHLLPRLRRHCGAIQILDVATGAGDIPRAILRWVGKDHKHVGIVGLDANPSVLAMARAECREEPDIRFLEGDAMELPFPDSSFDYVLCSLTLHHFSDGEAIQALKEMARVARMGIVVNDLRRGYLPAALIWLVTRVLFMNRLTRNDAPLSVMRSRTLDEYRVLAEKAGLEDAEVHKHAGWRAAIVALRHD